MIWVWSQDVADRVAVMYAGKIVEIGTTEEIFYQSEASVYMGTAAGAPGSCQREKQNCFTIPGMPPNLVTSTEGRCVCVHGIRTQLPD